MSIENAGKSRRWSDESFWHRHGLGIASLGLLILWIVLYLPANPSTHWGGFFGNAIADWSGTVVTVFGTKYLYEIGSAESRKIRGGAHMRLLRLLKVHSLSLF